ncbi:hypothetical protein PQR66_27665 [Paraburkholderia agricolaris]|uniref:Uncharacterized protein n=1 Tax=Paraburkholderia agricolaris TaxID=2152888 RepID=A0ABW8ZXM5_9BURK
MKSKFNCNARTSAVTVSIRQARPRVGTTHTYELNGTLLHDVLEDGEWITKRAVPAGEVQKRAA